MQGGHVLGVLNQGELLLGGGAEDVHEGWHVARRHGPRLLHRGDDGRDDDLLDVGAPLHDEGVQHLPRLPNV